MCSFIFAGYKNSAHTFSFAVYFLAATPAAQDWISEKARHVLGTHTGRRNGPLGLPSPQALLGAHVRDTAAVHAGPYVHNRGQPGNPATHRWWQVAQLLLPLKTMIVPSYVSVRILRAEARTRLNFVSRGSSNQQAGQHGVRRPS